MSFFSKLFSSMPSLDGLNAEELFELGMDNKRSGSYSNAIKCYKKALQQAPLETGLYTSLGKVQYLNKEYMPALSSYLKGCHLGMLNHIYAIRQDSSNTVMYEQMSGVSYRDNPQEYLIHAFFSSAKHIGHSYVDDPSLDEAIKEVFVPKQYRANITSYVTGLSGKPNNVESAEALEYYTLAGAAIMRKLIKWDRMAPKSEAEILEIILSYDR